MGYQRHWQLQSIHIGVGFVHDLIKAGVFWNKFFFKSFEHFKIFYV